MGEPLIQSREHISVELLPSSGPQDQSRFQADVAHVSDLIRGKTAHTFVTTSLPYFPRPVVFMARKLRNWLQKSDFLKKVSGEHRDLIVSLLAEMTHRQPSHTVGALEADVESRHIRTMPAQMYDWRTLQDNLRHLQDPAGLFVVSGGHPLQKIQKTLEIYDFHIAWLDYLLNGGLGQVDVREFMTDVRHAFPQKPLLGAWNYHTDTRGRVASKVHHGMQGMISQPASFMPDTFHRALMDLRSVPEGREIPILVGLPHVTSVAALKFWFILMNIIPEKHLEAAYLLENFQRAKKDGYVGAFSNQFTKHCIEWALALPGTAGIHFMGSKGESFDLLTDVLGVNQQPNGFGEASHLIATAFHRGEISYSQIGLRLVASPGLYSSEEKPKSKGHYAHELLSLLSPVREVIANIQQQYENHPFWNNTEIHFIRRSANNHAHTLPVEVITSDDGQIHEIRIDVRYDYSGDKIHLLLSLLQETLKAHLLDKKSDTLGIEMFDVSQRSPLLERLQRDGWSWFGDLQKARGEIGDAGTETAKKPEIIDISTHNILTALLEAEDQSEYVILESGAWHANGIPEILGKVETALSGHLQAEILRDRLKRTKYVCVDIAVEGVESCKKVLGQNHHTLGISYEYQVCDLMDDMSVKGLHDRYKGKVIFARSINVLDALQNRQYVDRGHNIYEMSYQTGILRRDLEHICHSSFEYFDEGKKTLFISLDVEAILHHFRHSTSPDGNEVSRFLTFLEGIYHIPQKAGLVIFEKILQAMKKCHSYHHDLRKDSIAHRVAAYHPDPQSPFTDSHQATHCVNSLVDMLCPGGRALFFQLQRDVVALHRSAHNTNTTPTTYHITPCFPVSIEAVEVVAHQKKFVTHILSGASFRLPSSSGGVLISCPR